jgi:type I restriction enzyme M protein
MEKNYVKTPKQREKMQGALRAVEKKQLPHMLCVTNMLRPAGAAIANTGIL